MSKRFTVSQFGREIVIYEMEPLNDPSRLGKREVGSFQGEYHPMSMMLLGIINDLAAELEELKKKVK